MVASHVYGKVGAEQFEIESFWGHGATCASIIDPDHFTSVGTAQDPAVARTCTRRNET